MRSNTQWVRIGAVLAALMAGTAGATSHAATLYGNAADTTVQIGGGYGWSGLTTTADADLVVGNAEWLRQHAILVFQLPQLGQVANPFDSADLSVRIFQRSGSGSGAITVSLDLIGLDRRSADPTVDVVDDGVTGDGDLDFAAPGTVLQSGFVTPAGVPYVVTGGTGLAAFLNAQYQGGAGAGEYVFVRLQPQEPVLDETTIAKYGLYGLDSADAALPGNRPAITYTAAIPEPTGLGLLGAAALCALRRRRA